VVTRLFQGKVQRAHGTGRHRRFPTPIWAWSTQLLALRHGRLLEVVNHGTGWVRMDYRVPARGLVGFRTEFLIETRGTGVLHHVFDGWEPWHGDLRTRRNGSMVADRRARRRPTR